MSVSAQFKRYASYTVGMILLAIGLTLTAQTHLGTSPLTSVAYVLAEYTHNTFSNMTLLMFTLFVLAQIALAGKPTARKTGSLVHHAVAPARRRCGARWASRQPLQAPPFPPPAWVRRPPERRQAPPNPSGCASAASGQTSASITSLRKNERTHREVTVPSTFSSDNANRPRPKPQDAPGPAPHYKPRRRQISSVVAL